MMMDFAVETKSGLLPETIAEQARQGDLSLILHHYEHDLKSPIKNIVIGTHRRNLDYCIS